MVSSGADPSPGEPPGDSGECQQHQKTIPGASAGLTKEEHDYLYQQNTVYDDDLMLTILTKCILNDPDINLVTILEIMLYYYTFRETHT